ncbi:MAG: hypothetical protein WCT04_09980 [Planctomycetota bacterium]
MQTKRVLAALLLLGTTLATTCFAADDASDAFAAAEAKYHKGHYKEALADYQAFQQRFPKDWHAEQAQFTAAFILEKKLKDSSKAAAAYQSISVAKAGAPMSHMAKFHLAATLAKSGETKKAIALYEELRTNSDRSRTREINRAIKFLRHATPDDLSDPYAWGEKWKGKRVRKLKKLSESKE